ncbi:MAG TPA: pantoate--beta-alanine ligase, partial [Methylomirabilota bacterium]|nr:pantoate--beta-alanine ligase [Methylomirabilota bacterium]
MTSVATMQKLALRWRRTGRRVGFVPTMGCLHEGHLSLVRQARRRVGPRGVVVVSIYVNPTQFGPREDFRRYPRDLKRDAGLCRAAGVDVLFAPRDEEMYPGGLANAPDPRAFSTFVEEGRLSRSMEGASRPTHFRGVTTVVAKLFNQVLPEVAVFGAKDWQQAAVITRMVRDLNFPVKLVVAPTSREPDGLALSSRNQYLTPAQRRQATVLWQALRLAAEQVRRSPAGVGVGRLRARVSRLVE